MAKKNSGNLNRQQEKKIWKTIMRKNVPTVTGVKASKKKTGLGGLGEYGINLVADELAEIGVVGKITKKVNKKINDSIQKKMTRRRGRPRGAHYFDRVPTVEKAVKKSQGYKGGTKSVPQSTLDALAKSADLLNEINGSKPELKKNGYTQSRELPSRASKPAAPVTISHGDWTAVKPGNTAKTNFSTTEENSGLRLFGHFSAEIKYLAMLFYEIVSKTPVDEDYDYVSYKPYSPKKDFKFQRIEGEKSTLLPVSLGKVSIRTHKADSITARDHWILTITWGNEKKTWTDGFSAKELCSDYDDRKPGNWELVKESLFNHGRDASFIESAEITNDVPYIDVLEYGMYKGHSKDRHTGKGPYGYEHGATEAGYSVQAPRGIMRVASAQMNVMAAGYNTGSPVPEDVVYNKPVAIHGGTIIRHSNNDPSFGNEGLPDAAGREENGYARQGDLLDRIIEETINNYEARGEALTEREIGEAIVKNTKIPLNEYFNTIKKELADKALERFNNSEARKNAQSKIDSDWQKKLEAHARNLKRKADAAEKRRIQEIKRVERKVQMEIRRHEKEEERKRKAEERAARAAEKAMQITIKTQRTTIRKKIQTPETVRRKLKEEILYTSYIDTGNGPRQIYIKKENKNLYFLYMDTVKTKDISQILNSSGWVLFSSLLKLDATNYYKDMSRQEYNIKLGRDEHPLKKEMVKKAFEDVFSEERFDEL
jgi:hypothetical protein